jgi:hypothetical protein
MPTDTTQAASSPAEVVDVFQGQQPTMSEYSQYRATGEVPERFKPEEVQPTDAPEETAEVPEDEDPENAPEPDPEEKQQEPPAKVSPAQKRILQLLAEKKDLERKLAATAKQDAKPDSSTVQPSQPTQPQNYQDYRKAFKPSQFIEEYAKANPDASYEDANAAMADHLYEVRKHFDKIEERVQTETKALNAKVEEAKERYENFDEIKDTFLGKVLGDKGMPLIPLPVLAIINDSDVLADLIYTLGSDEKATADFVKLAQSNPNQAIRHIARLEVGIQDELKSGTAGKTESEKAPVVKKTQAPKPPEPVSGVSSRSFDVSDESLSPEDWMRKRNQQIAKKG